MLPIFTRLNAVLTSAMTVLAAMTVGLSLSTGYFEFVSGLDEAVVSVHEPQILKAWRDTATREDVVMVGIKFKADMRPLWHWNVKQVFLYCTASWTTKGRLHETFLYDVIIREPQEHIVGSDDRPVLDYVLKGDQGTLVYAMPSFVLFASFVPPSSFHTSLSLCTAHTTTLSPPTTAVTTLPSM